MLCAIHQAYRESVEDSTSASVDIHLDADPAKRPARLAEIESFCKAQEIPYEYERMSLEQLSLVSIYLQNAR